jgi:hypothetical protein
LAVRFAAMMMRSGAQRFRLVDKCKHLSFETISVRIGHRKVDNGEVSAQSNDALVLVFHRHESNEERVCVKSTFPAGAKKVHMEALGLRSRRIRIFGRCWALAACAESHSAKTVVGATLRA